MLTDAPAPADARRDLAVDLGLLALANLVLRLPSYLASAHLTFDDGVYGVSALAMRDGDVPFRDVFSPQGPAFLPAVWLFDLVGGRTASSPRLFPLLSGIALVLLVYVLGRQLSDRRGALLAAAVATVAGSVLWVTSPVAADGPAAAFALGALVVALRHRRHPTLGRAAAIGVLAALGIATKLVMVATLVPVAVAMLTPWWADLRQRRVPGPLVAQVAVAGGLALALPVLLAVPFGAGEVWDQYIDYHRDAGVGHRDLGDNVSKIATTIPDRNVAAVVLAGAALVAGLQRRRQGEVRPGRPEPPPARPVSDTVAVVAWLVVTALTLLAYAPLFRPHLVVLVPPLALLAGMHRPPGRVAVALLVVAVAVQVVRDSEIVHPDPYQGRDAEVAADLRGLPAGSWILSDEPGFGWRTGHRTPADLVDASIHRIETGRITAESLAAAASEPPVCAVQVWSHRFGDLQDLPGLLEAAGYEVAATYGGDPARTLWVRASCPIDRTRSTSG